jgi:hypothetical protein
MMNAGKIEERKVGNDRIAYRGRKRRKKGRGGLGVAKPEPAACRKKQKSFFCLKEDRATDSLATRRRFGDDSETGGGA